MASTSGNVDHTSKPANCRSASSAPQVEHTRVLLSWREIAMNRGFSMAASQRGQVGIEIVSIQVL